MHLSRAAHTLAVASAFALLAACSRTVVDSQTGATATIGSNGTTMHVESSEGSFTAGATTLPADWPSDAPVYPGATITYTASANPTTGKPGNAIVFTTTDGTQQVVAYYKTALKQNGWAINTTMDGGATFVMGGTKEGRGLSLMIAGTDGQTSVTLAIEQSGQ